jgi:hypothetical protein
MKIENVENNIDNVSDINHVSIIELIIDAVRTYPLYELDETESYFREVKRLLKSDDISLENLKDYLTNNANLDEEETVWINDSLNSLTEAFELMLLYRISFTEIKSIMEVLT